MPCFPPHRRLRCGSGGSGSRGVGIVKREDQRRINEKIRTQEWTGKETLGFSSSLFFLGFSWDMQIGCKLLEEKGGRRTG